MGLRCIPLEVTVDQLRYELARVYEELGYQRRWKIFFMVLTALGAAGCGVLLAAIYFGWLGQP